MIVCKAFLLSEPGLLDKCDGWDIDEVILVL